MDVTKTPAEDAAACRSTGAPVALLCHNSEILWWKQGDSNSQQYINVPIHHAERFFKEHKDDLSPNTLYRAKTLGRFDSSYQREFVDLGLMPAVEQEMGQVIERLLLDQVSDLRAKLGWPSDLSEKQGQWLVKAVFWLLGAKMLHDKRVEGFIRLDFSNVETVFERVAQHYGESAEAIISSQKKLKALQSVANVISQRADLRLASTESLAYVYENTLISKEVRKGLGTHSTPAYLIDYIVGRLAPWIEEMPQEHRTVFEPACGHGGFLVAAVRLLTNLLPAENATPKQRRSYLRQHIRGCDKDSFALEIARLSLTLTDIPNPNGWKLQEGDAFSTDRLEVAASSARILLANPPFEKFTPEQREQYTRDYQNPSHVNKAAEMLYRSISALPKGGVFGLVIPQVILHSKDAIPFRKMLAEEAEFEEICLFPDKVFNFADVETAILIGKKGGKGQTTRYRRVREGDIENFKDQYKATSEVTISSSRFSAANNYDFRVPDLEEIWDYCSEIEDFHTCVKIGRGFSFLGKDNKKFPEGHQRMSLTPKAGHEEGFLKINSNLTTHSLPQTAFLNSSESILAVKRSGQSTGLPQVICNYSPVQRNAWCVVSMMDKRGLCLTDRFSVMRTKSKAWTNEVIWAFTNSPFMNAYAYTHSTKRDIITGTWKSCPVPSIDEIPTDLVKAVNAYFSATQQYESRFTLSSDEDTTADNEHLKLLHWKIDAEVLNLYKLPVELERKLLDYFVGVKRVGVPFHQDRYFPEYFDLPISLCDYLAITTEWESTNSRRLKLIDLKLDGKLTPTQEQEFSKLQKLAEAKSALVMPLPRAELAKQEAELRRRGIWEGE